MMNTISKGGLDFTGGERFLVKKGTFWMKILGQFHISGPFLGHFWTIFQPFLNNFGLHLDGFWTVLDQTETGPIIGIIPIKNFDTKNWAKNDFDSTVKLRK